MLGSREPTTQMFTFGALGSSIPHVLRVSRGVHKDFPLGPQAFVGPSDSDGAAIKACSSSLKKQSTELDVLKDFLNRVVTIVEPYDLS